MYHAKWKKEEKKNKEKRKKNKLIVFTRKQNKGPRNGSHVVILQTIFSARNIFCFYFDMEPKLDKK